MEDQQSRSRESCIVSQHCCVTKPINSSDNAGKNTGDKEIVKAVKEKLGYVENSWVGGDETTRWGKEGEPAN